MARIILIEPDRLLAETYVRSLEAAGNDVVPCAGAQAAVMAADRGRPDLVILEVQLVRHSGIEFLYEFRSYSDWQNIPVLVHSQVPPAEFNGAWQGMSERLGVREYLYKPITDLAQLQAAVTRHTRQPAEVV